MLPLLTSDLEQDTGWLGAPQRSGLRLGFTLKVLDLVENPNAMPDVGQVHTSQRTDGSTHQGRIAGYQGSTEGLFSDA